MKYIKKRLISIGMCACLLSTLTGCGTYFGNEAVETTTLSKEPKELVLWYTNEELSEYIEKTVSEYEATNHVSITTKLVSGIDYIENMNQAVLSEDQAPDLFIAENSNLEKIYLAGLSTDITDEVLNENNYYKTALNAFTFKDKILAYPMYFETSYLLYNQDYVQQPPESIEDILLFADEFDAPEGVESILNWDVTDILCNYFFIGKYLNNDEINNENYIVDKEKLTEAFAYYQNLNQYFAIDSSSIDYEMAFQNFIDGKSVFTIAKTDKLPEIEMIEGDVNEEVQADSDAKDNGNSNTIKDGSNEAEENADEKAQNEENVNKSVKETSKNDETDNEGSSKESVKTAKSSYGLEESYYAGIEKVLRKIPKEETKIEQPEQIEEENELEQDESEQNLPVKSENDKFKIAVLPNLTNNLESAGISINYGVVVSGYTKEMEESKAFAKFLAYENAQNLYKEAGKLSSRNHLIYENENIEAVLRQYEKSVCVPKIMENGDYWLKLEIYFSNIWNATPVEQIIDEMIR
ncbi:MAG: extracellular solute-binding protein [Candidatus Galacturonibacter soehngenii]|nr:extracellular solute-binding protein [Candidatus Galacturonibacter soehngenii]